MIIASGTNPLADVLSNDIDSDGEPLTITIEGTPDIGTAAVEKRSRSSHASRHPSENTALFSTTLNDPMTEISDELWEVDLVAGAPTRLQSEARTSSAPRC